MKNKNLEAFITYCFSFYGPKGLYPIAHLTEEELYKAIASLTFSNHEFADGDSIDREKVRDEVLNNRLVIVTTI